MIRFSLKNLWSQKVRSILCIVGISVAIVGVVCIFAFSSGLKASVNSAINLVNGVVILQNGKPDPVFSSVPLRLKNPLEENRGIRNVIPWIWAIPGGVEGQMLVERSSLAPEIVGGVDLKEMAETPDGHLYARSMVKGRFLQVGDQKKAVLSVHLANRYDKSIGKTFTIDGTAYEIVGLYRTGNRIMDMAIILPIDEVRPTRNLDPSYVSDLFLVPEDDISPELIENIEQTLLTIDKKALEKWDVRTKQEWKTDFSGMMGEIDIFLILISSLAVFVGTVGIINTMLMNITERTSEFGILIANGWSRRDIVKLVLFESTILGMISGVVGIVVGWGAVHLTNILFDLSITAETPVSLLLYAFLVALLIGIVGGVYPAYRAISKDPIEAIRSIR